MGRAGVCLPFTVQLRTRRGDSAPHISWQVGYGPPRTPIPSIPPSSTSRDLHLHETGLPENPLGEALEPVSGHVLQDLEELVFPPRHHLLVSTAAGADKVFHVVY